jgi:hypothetical protein
MKLGDAAVPAYAQCWAGPRKSLNQSSSRFRFRERNCAIRTRLRFPSVFALALIPTARDRPGKTKLPNLWSIILRESSSSSLLAILPLGIRH